MKKLATFILILLSSFGLDLRSQELKLPEGLTANTYTNEFLDTLNVRKSLELNDYSMFGISYGANLSRVMWNPRQNQDLLFLPMNIGISYTKYGKMFGYMPFFGFQIGVNYTQEGYQFEYNEEKEYTYKIEGAEKAIFDVIEVPMYMHCHYDLWNFKIIAQAGCYAGYRIGIQRFPGKTGYVDPDVEHSFVETDRRLDYGLKGSVGFGLVFDPFEFHFMATYKHSFGSLYEPDHYSEYYYRYAYPMNITISAGIHVHLSKRTGMSKSALKKQAREIVYGK